MVNVIFYREWFGFSKMVREGFLFLVQKVSFKESLFVCVDKVGGMVLVWLGFSDLFRFFVFFKYCVVRFFEFFCCFNSRFEFIMFDLSLMRKMMFI